MTKSENTVLEKVVFYVRVVCFYLKD